LRSPRRSWASAASAPIRSRPAIPPGTLLDGIRTGFLVGGTISVLAVIVAAVPKAQREAQEQDAEPSGVSQPVRPSS
jgi:hypothetical protein